MNKITHERSEDEWMHDRLQGLKAVPGRERSREAEQTGKARFLSEAAALRKAIPVRDASRPLGLWETFTSFVSGKQGRLAFYTATVLCVVLGLLLASGGMVAFAAQGSQPDQILYPVKLISENVRLGLAANPQSQFQLNMEFAGRRLDEIDNLVQAGKDPSSQVTDRLQNELNAAMDNAANLDNTASVKALENLQANLQQHENQLVKLQSQDNPHATANYTRVVEMLQQKVNQAEQGIKDPQSIHEIIKQQHKQDNQPPKATATPPAAMNNVVESTNTSTPAATAADTAATTAPTEQKINPGQCNNSNKSNNGNGNGNGNGNQCAGSGTQVTAPPAQPNAATEQPKSNNPNKPVKTPKGSSDKSNKGGNGHKK